MTVAATLLALVEAGVTLWVDGDRLRYRAPVGALSPELRERANASRGALIALLRAGACLPLSLRAWPEADREAYEELAGHLEFDGGASRVDAERTAELRLRVDHAQSFVARAALVVTPVAAAVANGASGSGPHRRP